MGNGAFAGIGGASRNVSQPSVGISNVNRTVYGGYAEVDGVNRQFFRRGIEITSEFTPSTQDEGTQYGVQLVSNELKIYMNNRFSIDPMSSWNNHNYFIVDFDGFCAGDEVTIRFSDGVPANYSAIQIYYARTLIKDWDAYGSRKLYTFTAEASQKLRVRVSSGYECNQSCTINSLIVNGELLDLTTIVIHE